MKDEILFSNLRFTWKDMMDFKYKYPNMVMSEFVDNKNDDFDIKHPYLYQHILSLCSNTVGVDVIKTMSKNREFDAVFARYMTMFFLRRLSDQY